MTADPVQLRRRRELWEGKPALREVYRDFHRRIRAASRPGVTLEIGGGVGSLKSFAPEILSTDLQIAPWLDFASRAEALPVRHSSLDNIVMIDVLHHLASPRRFFEEASRALRTGGRIVMVEPAITWASGWFYRNFHPEPVDMRVDPLADAALRESASPGDGNQAIPTILFANGIDQFETAFPGLRVENRIWLSLLAYPLSGGYRPWSLVPAWLVRPLLRFEDAILPWLGHLLGFRMLVVVARHSP